MDPSIREVEEIKDFQNCINEFSEMCSCQGEVKEIKRKECEEKYKNIILNHMDKIKSYLLEFDPEFTFNSGTSGQDHLISISLNN
jgi:hypothetical protein